MNYERMEKIVDFLAAATHYAAASKLGLPRAALLEFRDEFIAADAACRIDMFDFSEMLELVKRNHEPR